MSVCLSVYLSVCLCVCPANILVFYFSAFRRAIDLKCMQDTNRDVLNSLSCILPDYNKVSLYSIKVPSFHVYDPGSQGGESLPIQATIFTQQGGLVTCGLSSHQTSSGARLCVKSFVSHPPNPWVICHFMYMFINIPIFPVLINVVLFHCVTSSR